MVDPREIQRSLYDFAEELGHGRFAKVIRATEKDYQDKCAIKIILKDPNPGSDLMKNLMREIDILWRVDHPHILKLDRVIDTPKKLHLVHELGKKALGTMLDEKKVFTEDEARKVTKQLCTAVAYLHDNGLVHKDLSLETVLLVRNPRDFNDELYVKLTGFGTPVTMTPWDCKYRLPDHIGNSFYTAPEIVRKKPYGPLSDVWAMGVILFLLLTGEFPFIDYTKKAVFDWISYREPDYTRLSDVVDLSVVHPLLKNYSDGVAKRINEGWMIHLHKYRAEALLRRMFDKSPETRIWSQSILNDPWMNDKEVTLPFDDYNVELKRQLQLAEDHYMLSENNRTEALVGQTRRLSVVNTSLTQDQAYERILKNIEPRTADNIRDLQNRSTAANIEPLPSRIFLWLKNNNSELHDKNKKLLEKLNSMKKIDIDKAMKMIDLNKPRKMTDLDKPRKMIDLDKPKKMIDLDKPMKMIDLDKPMKMTDRNKENIPSSPRTEEIWASHFIWNSEGDSKNVVSISSPSLGHCKGRGDISELDHHKISDSKLLTKTKTLSSISQIETMKTNVVDIFTCTTESRDKLAEKVKKVQSKPTKHKDEKSDKQLLNKGPHTTDTTENLSETMDKKRKPKLTLENILEAKKIMTSSTSLSGSEDNLKYIRDKLAAKVENVKKVESKPRKLKDEKSDKQLLNKGLHIKETSENLSETMSKKRTPKLALENILKTKEILIASTCLSGCEDNLSYSSDKLAEKVEKVKKVGSKPSKLKAEKSDKQLLNKGPHTKETTQNLSETMNEKRAPKLALENILVTKEILTSSTSLSGSEDNLEYGNGYSRDILSKKVENMQSNPSKLRVEESDEQLTISLCAKESMENLLEIIGKELNPKRALENILEAMELQTSSTSLSGSEDGLSYREKLSGKAEEVEKVEINPSNLKDEKSDKQLLNKGPHTKDTTKNLSETMGRRLKRTLVLDNILKSIETETSSENVTVCESDMRHREKLTGKAENAEEVEKVEKVEIKPSNLKDEKSDKQLLNKGLHTKEITKNMSEVMVRRMKRRLVLDKILKSIETEPSSEDVIVCENDLRDREKLTGRAEKAENEEKVEKVEIKPSTLKDEKSDKQLLSKGLHTKDTTKNLSETMVRRMKRRLVLDNILKSIETEPSSENVIGSGDDLKHREKLAGKVENVESKPSNLKDERSHKQLLNKGPYTKESTEYLSETMGKDLKATSALENILQTKKTLTSSENVIGCGDDPRHRSKEHSDEEENPENEQEEQKWKSRAEKILAELGESHQPSLRRIWAKRSLTSVEDVTDKDAINTFDTCPVDEECLLKCNILTTILDTLIDEFDGRRYEDSWFNDNDAGKLKIFKLVFEILGGNPTDERWRNSWITLVSKSLINPKHGPIIMDLLNCLTDKSSERRELSLSQIRLKKPWLKKPSEFIMHPKYGVLLLPILDILVNETRSRKSTFLKVVRTVRPRKPRTADNLQKALNKMSETSKKLDFLPLTVSSVWTEFMEEREKRAKQAKKKSVTFGEVQVYSYSVPDSPESKDPWDGCTYFIQELFKHQVPKQPEKSSGSSSADGAKYMKLSKVESHPAITKTPYRYASLTEMESKVITSPASPEIDRPRSAGSPLGLFKTTSKQMPILKEATTSENKTQTTGKMKSSKSSDVSESSLMDHSSDHRIHSAIKIRETSNDLLCWPKGKRKNKGEYPEVTVESHPDITTTPYRSASLTEMESKVITGPASPDIVSPRSAGSPLELFKTTSKQMPILKEATRSKNKTQKERKKKSTKSSDESDSSSMDHSSDHTIHSTIETEGTSNALLGCKKLRRKKKKGKCPEVTVESHPAITKRPYRSASLTELESPASPDIVRPRSAGCTLELFKTTSKQMPILKEATTSKNKTQKERKKKSTKSSDESESSSMDHSSDQGIDIEGASNDFLRCKKLRKKKKGKYPEVTSTGTKITKKVSWKPSRELEVRYARGISLVTSDEEIPPLSMESHKNATLLTEKQKTISKFTVSRPRKKGSSSSSSQSTTSSTSSARSSGDRQKRIKLRPKKKSEGSLQDSKTPISHEY